MVKIVVVDQLEILNYFLYNSSFIGLTPGLNQSVVLK